MVLWNFFLAFFIFVLVAALAFFCLLLCAVTATVFVRYTWVMFEKLSRKLAVVIPSYSRCINWLLIFKWAYRCSKRRKNLAQEF